MSELLERLLRNVAVPEEQLESTGCWVYTKGLNPSGYCYVSVRQAGRHRKVRAHVLLFSLWHETAIEPGMHLDHTCVEPRCINPDHLEPVTHKENMRRRDARARLRIEQTGDTF